MIHISLADAVTVTEEVSIDVEEIRKPRRVEGQQQTALLAHATLKKKLRQGHSHRYYNQSAPNFLKLPHFRQFDRGCSYVQERLYELYNPNDLRHNLSNKNHGQQNAVNNKRSKFRQKRI